MMPEEPTRMEEEDPFAGIGKGQSSYPPPQKLSAVEIARKIVAIVVCVLGGVAVLVGCVFAIAFQETNYAKLGWAIGGLIFAFAATIYDGWLF